MTERNVLRNMPTVPSEVERYTQSANVLRNMPTVRYHKYTVSLCVLELMGPCASS